MTKPERYRRAERALFAAAGIDAREHRIPLPRLGVTARVHDIGEGTPTVFPPGGPNAAATWAYLAGACDGLRCLLVDRPGTGLSKPPPVIPNAASLPGYVEQLTVDILDGLELDRANLVGSSFGCYRCSRTRDTCRRPHDRPRPRRTCRAPGASPSLERTTAGLGRSVG